MKQDLKRFTALPLLIPVTLAVVAVVIDVLIIGGLSASPAIYLREVLIVTGLILSLPIIYRQKWASDRNVLRGLRSLFLMVAMTFVALMLTNLDIFDLRSRAEAAGSIYASLLSYVFILAWAILTAIFALLVMGTLRNLIFIKQRRHTARNFHLLVFFLLFYAVLNFRNFDNLAGRFSFGFSEDLVGNVILFVLINLMVINSLRVSWLNYLNKKQKLACFWGGLILITMQWFLADKFHDTNPAALFSPVLGKFVDMAMWLLAIYLTVAFISLVFLLPTAQLYDRKMRQISSLHHLSRAVSIEFDFKKLVQIVVRLATDVSEAESCWLELFDTRHHKLLVASALQASEGQPRDRDPEAADPLTRWVLSSREPVLINHLAKSPYAQSLVHWKPDIQSLLVVPLTASDKVLGMLFVGKRMEYGFEQDDVNTLRAFGEQVVIAIENVRLIEASLVKERLEQELRIAHEAQMKLLPRVMPASEYFEVYAQCITANEVGGDYFDFFPLSDERVGMVVGDVSGKGASAAFYMAELKGIMEASSRNEPSPKRVLVLANETLYHNLERDNFVSVIYGILDPVNRCLTFCRAGHTPAYLVSADSDDVQVLEPPGIGLGLDRGFLFAETLEESTVSLQSGDALLLYTDGAIEPRNEAGDEFGERRLREAFYRYRALSARDIIEQLVSDIRRFVGSAQSYDDLTFIAVKIK
jgi:phosphoserine phosphatase RsbU/P